MSIISPSAELLFFQVGVLMYVYRTQETKHPLYSLRFDSGYTSE